jgi:hypothetical protein
MQEKQMMIKSPSGEKTPKTPQHRVNLNSRNKTKGEKMIRDSYSLDIQNLVSKGMFSEATSFLMRQQLEDLFGLRPEDQIYVATGPGTLFQAKLAFPDGEVKIGRGPNGADYKLKEHLSDLIPQAATFGTIFVGTGDHEVIDEVTALRDAGGNVVLVGVRGTIHNPYKNLGIQIVELEPIVSLESADWMLTA